jgi:hypothetical protein
MQWKTTLRRLARGAGHQLGPIKRTSAKPTNTGLSRTSNDYDASCKHCFLSVTVHTMPGEPATFYFIVGTRRYAAEQLPKCEVGR